MLTCTIRPSGIWGRGDQTMFRKVFESVLAGHVKVLVGSKDVKLDNSYVHNLIHGFILAAEHLVPGGTAPGQAYFINDGEPINMFEFSRPVVEACGQPLARSSGCSGRLVHTVMTVWQWLHFRFGLPQAAAGTACGGTDLPATTTSRSPRPSAISATSRCSPPKQAMADCLPYYTDLFDQMKARARRPCPRPREYRLRTSAQALTRAHARE